MSRRKPSAPEPPTPKPQTQPWRAFAPVIVALICVGLAFALRLGHFHSLPQFNPDDDTALFTTEDALQFRYARMVASGRGIPDFDPTLHHPDGFGVRENLTTLVERIEGGLYPVIGGGAPFHMFLVALVCLVTSLGVIGAYGVAACLWRNRWAGAFAAFLYAVAVPTYVRIIGGYGTEHFALPLLFIGTWPFLAVLGESERGIWKQRVLVLLSGSLFALALGAWHLSRFLFTLFLGVLVAVWLYLHLTRSPEAVRLSGLVPWLLAPVILVSALVPILQARPFWSSPVFLLTAAVPASEWLSRSRSPRTRLLAWGLLGAISILVISLLASPETGYSHVWGIVAAKLVHLGAKPANPTRLPFEIRALWIEDVHGPRPGPFLMSFGLIPVLALLGGVMGFRQARERMLEPRALLLLGLAAGAITVYLLFARMIGFAAFFLVVLCAGVVTAPRPVLLAAVLCLLAETHRSAFYAAPAPWKSALTAAFPLPQPVVPMWQENTTELFAWIRQHTGSNDAFLARMGVSGTIAAYTDRPVVLQSKMENREIWPRLRGFLNALYGPEEAFYAYCQEKQVRYFVYESVLALDSTIDSERYTSGSRPLRRDATAYRCQFQPEALRRLTLVYQDSYFRVFRVEPSARREPLRGFAYQPGYDLRLFGTQDGEYFRDEGTEPVMARLGEARYRWDTARALLAARQPGEALREARQARELNPGIQGLRVTIALAHGLMGNEAEGIPVLEEEVRFFPDEVLARYYLGLFLVKTGRRAEGAQHWAEGLRRDPENAAIRTAQARYLGVQ